MMTYQQEKIFPPDKDKRTVLVHEQQLANFWDFLSDKQQCLLHLSKMTEHISAPVFALPGLQEVEGTSGLMAMTTVAQAWAETGTSPLTPSHHISSQTCCSWDPTNTTRNGTKHLDTSEAHPGPSSSACADTSPGCWQMTQEKAFVLVQEGATAASEVPGSLCCW